MPAAYVATPDGNSRRSSARVVRVYQHPGYIRCPTCDTCLSRFTARGGDHFMTCEALVRDPGGRNKHRCGQHLYILASTARLWAVVTISKDEFEMTSACTDEAARLLHNLGIVPAAYRALADAKVAS